MVEFWTPLKRKITWPDEVAGAGGTVHVVVNEVSVFPVLFVHEASMIQPVPSPGTRPVSRVTFAGMRGLFPGRRVKGPWSVTSFPVRSISRIRSPLVSRTWPGAISCTIELGRKPPGVMTSWSAMIELLVVLEAGSSGTIT